MGAEGELIHVKMELTKDQLLLMEDCFVHNLKLSNENDGCIALLIWLSKSIVDEWIGDCHQYHKNSVEVTVDAQLLSCVKAMSLKETNVGQSEDSTLELGQTSTICKSNLQNELKVPHLPLNKIVVETPIQEVKEEPLVDMVPEKDCVNFEDVYLCDDEQSNVLKSEFCDITAADDNFEVVQNTAPLSENDGDHIKYKNLGIHFEDVDFQMQHSDDPCIFKSDISMNNRGDDDNVLELTGEKRDTSTKSSALLLSTNVDPKDTIGITNVFQKQKVRPSISNIALEDLSKCAKYKSVVSEIENSKNRLATIKTNKKSTACDVKLKYKPVPSEHMKDCVENGDCKIENESVPSLYEIKDEYCELIYDKSMHANGFLNEGVLAEVNSKNSLSSISQNIHEKTFACDSCAESFSSIDMLTVHKWIHTAERPFTCDMHANGFLNEGVLAEVNSKNSLSSISQNIHEKTFACDSCAESFSSIDMLTVHKWIHTAERPFTCDICNSYCSDSSSLKIHMRKHTGEKPFACDICHMRFAAAYNLISHKRRHTGEKPFFCDMCNMRFIRSRCLNRHKLVVHGERCNILFQSLYKSSSFASGKTIHAGDEKFPCNICNSIFTNARNLGVHKKKHTQEQTYNCNICNKSFSAAYNLILHKKRHTGEKPYICDICNKSFTLCYELTLHKRRHTGVKPFSCDSCSASFYRNIDLTKHIIKHTGEGPFICNVCHKTFSNASSLRLHKNKHSDEKKP